MSLYTLGDTPLSDSEDEMDQAVLAAFKPPGVEPGKTYDPASAAAIDSAKFVDAARKIQQEVLAIWTNPEGNPCVNDLFKHKGQMTLEPMVVQSVYGPVGLPADQAVYPGIVTADGEPDENWLPINRKDENLDVVMRIYAPDLEKMESWKTPLAERINNRH